MQILDGPSPASINPVSGELTYSTKGLDLRPGETQHLEFKIAATDIADAQTVIAIGIDVMRSEQDNKQPYDVSIKDVAVHQTPILKEGFSEAYTSKELFAADDKQGSAKDKNGGLG